MTLERKTPMKRGGPLARSAMKRGSKRIAPKSKKRRADVERAKVREAVLARDRQCRACGVVPFRCDQAPTDMHSLGSAVRVVRLRGSRRMRGSRSTRRKRALGLALRTGDPIPEA